MIDRANAVQTVLTKLKKLPDGCGLEVRTYKRDRGVSVRRVSADSYVVREEGFHTQCLEVDAKKLKKLLKSLFKTEFPRSNKLWLQELGPTEQAGRPPFTPAS